MEKNDRPTEFDLIQTYFAPLAKSEAGAFDLTDDAAVLSIEQGREMVVTTDTIVSGVHFLNDTPAEAVAAKLLRVSLSDLAAMGATPHSYTLSLALTETITGDWLSSFSASLARDQDAYDIILVGGDTVSTPGPLTLTLTAIGTVLKGKALRRNGAQEGDDVYVSGTIGDGALGLLVALEEISGLSNDAAEFLLDRYYYPQSRGRLGEKLLGLAHAVADVSDGLAADLGQICQPSGVSAVIHSSLVPLSNAAKAVLNQDSGYFQQILGGGDDYELIFTAAKSDGEKINDLSEEIGIQVRRIGSITAENDEDVVIKDWAGEPMLLHQKGFRHF
jgi:thiamine-monophosphate kinase